MVFERKSKRFDLRAPIKSKKARSLQARAPIAGLLLIFLLLRLLLASSPAWAQSDGSQLQVVEIDATAFPDMFMRLVARDAAGNAITSPAGLKLKEDDSPVEDYEVAPIDPGAELIVIIDANTSFEDRDGSDELSRREKVRDSLIRYANHFMDPMQKDRVTIIVPDGQDARILDETNLAFPNEVINAVNFYQTGELTDTNLNRMFQVALDHALVHKANGRHQSILLFSDAADLDDKLEYEFVINQAQEHEVTIYGAILGNRADAEETENIRALVEPTSGTFVHMPDSVLTDPVYEAIQQRASQLAISYRSRLNTSGKHILAVELLSAQITEQFELSVAAPVVQMAVDNSRPIRRVAETADVPLESMVPTQQPLVAQVDWPDDHPRDLVAAELLIREVPIPAEQAILDDTGLLTFKWDISQLDEGVYDLQVQVTDELGLQGISDPLALTIVVERPTVAATSTSEPIPTPVPTAPVIEPELAANETAPLGVAMIAGGVLLLLILIVAVIAALITLRRRSGEESNVQPTSGELSRAELDSNYTYIVPPEFALAAGVGAYLEVLENAPEHREPVPLMSSNIALGRDSRRVQVVFNDRSVSRLHARILESRGEYRIYEEGSSSGTYVNFERLGLTPRTLRDMDHIHLGRVHLRFHLASSLKESTVQPGSSNSKTGIPGN